MLPGRGALRSVTSAARRAPLAGQLGSSTRGYATSRIGGGRHVLSAGASPLTRLRSGAAAGPVVGQARAFSLWGWGSKKSPEPPAAPPAEAAQAAQPPAEATQTAQPPAEATQTAQPPAEAAAPTSAVTDPAAAASPVHPDTVSSDISNIIGSELDAYGSVSSIPEGIGYLNTLGIEFGWGTTTSIQWFVEHLHVYSGLPWWGTILATSVIFRALLWKPTLLAQEHGTRMALLKQEEPEYAKAEAALKVATVSRDTVGMQAIRMVMKDIEERRDVNKFMPMITMVQLPLGFGMFRILKAMAEIPVPGLENGGCLWFTNLAVPDPWYILPLVGPVAMVMAMRLTSRYNPPKQQQTMKMITTVMVPAGLVLTSFLPAGLQFYFAASGTLGLFQTSLLFNPGFRNFIGLSPAPKPIDPPEATADAGKGYLQSIKDSIANAQKTVGTKMDESAQKKEVKTNVEEEARLQAEYYESLRERMAELEKKMKRRP